MKEYKQLWVWKKTWDKLREIYPAYEEETLVNYFERLTKYLYKLQAEWDGYEQDEDYKEMFDND